MNHKNKNKEGVVYSTNPDFQYQLNNSQQNTLDPSKQKLSVLTDSRMRAGKIVTIVNGFIGKEDDLESLGKLLKTSCGSGGTVKDGIVMIQGNFKDRIIDLLKKKGYKVV